MACVSQFIDRAKIIANQNITANANAFALDEVARVTVGSFPYDIQLEAEIEVAAQSGTAFPIACIVPATSLASLPILSTLGQQHPLSAVPVISSTFAGAKLRFSATLDPGQPGDYVCGVGNLSGSALVVGSSLQVGKFWAHR